jgi:hypothetical protein
LFKTINEGSVKRNRKKLRYLMKKIFVLTLLLTAFIGSTSLAGAKRNQRGFLLALQGKWLPKSGTKCEINGNPITALKVEYNPKKILATFSMSNGKEFYKAFSTKDERWLGRRGKSKGIVHVREPIVIPEKSLIKVAAINRSPALKPPKYLVTWLAEFDLVADKELAMNFISFPMVSDTKGISTDIKASLSECVFTK